MKQQNFVYVDKQIHYTGFEVKKEGLIDALNSGRDQVLETNQQIKEHSFPAKLKLRRSKDTDFYFFNSYQIGIKLGNDYVVRPQTFKIDNNFYPLENGKKGSRTPNITQKEAINLMFGRPVKKDIGKEVNGVMQWNEVWVQMDFKSSDANGNYKLEQYPDFDLNEKINKLPLKEKENEVHLGYLVDSLEKGNIQLATFMVDGTEVKGYVEANARFDELFTYDENMKRQNFSIVEPNSQSVAENQNRSLAEVDKVANTENTISPGSAKDDGKSVADDGKNEIKIEAETENKGIDFSKLLDEGKKPDLAGQKPLTDKQGKTEKKGKTHSM